MELPDPSILKLVVQRYAGVVETLALDPGEQPLILPTGEWFPDRFTGDQASFEALVARMQGYAGLEDTPIEAVLTGEIPGGGCSTGGSCGCSTPSQSTASEGPRLVALERGFRLEMPGAALKHPIAFTATVASLLGSVRLMLAGDRSGDLARAELAATALGFGVLLFEASHIYSKGCGGPSVGQATKLGAGELAVPLALFIACEGHKVRSAASELAPTQRELLNEAWALVDTNRGLVADLKNHPERVKSGRIELKTARSWLARLFSGKKPKTNRDANELALSALERGENLDDVAALLESEAPLRGSRPSSAKKPKDDVGDLVDEALAELRAGQ